jgi:hypothetical protein
VIALLESIGALMPGVGFLLGGVLTALTSPRTTFLVAGLGVLAVVVVAAVAARYATFESRPVREGHRTA